MSNQDPNLYGEYEDHVLKILQDFGVTSDLDPLNDRAFGEVCLYLLTHQVPIEGGDIHDPRENPDVIYALYHFACWNNPQAPVTSRRLTVLQLRRRRVA